MIKILTFFLSLPKRIKNYILINWPLFLVWKVNIFFEMRRIKKEHGLSSPLIISLTSYPARFKTLPLTLKCLLSQSMDSDKVILWIAHHDKSALTPEILRLQKFGLDILYCEDLRSYKKIIPTLQNFPNSFIVTADDDIYYWHTWLEELVTSYKNSGNDVICHRAHRIVLGQDGLPLPYSEWELETTKLDASPLNFQTGVGGVLYPPNIFYCDILNADIFKVLCLQADDAWLYWMLRLNGFMVRRVKNINQIYLWPTSQESALYHTNVAGGGNDIQIRALINAYNFPTPI